MNSRPNRHLRRELEAELRDLPVSPPPADLLAKIRAEIPADLRAANSEEPAPAAPRRFVGSPGFRLAASIAVAVVGVALGYRVLERESSRSVDDPAAGGKGARTESAPLDAVAAEKQDQDKKLSLKGKTKEVGGEGDARDASAELRLDHLAPQAKRAAPSTPAAATAPAPSEAVASKLAALGYVGGSPSESDVQRDRGRLAETFETEIARPMPAPDPVPASPEQVEESVTVRGASPLLDARRPAASAAAAPTQESRRNESVQPQKRQEAPTREGAERRRAVAVDAAAAPEPLRALDYVTGGAAPSTGGEREPNEQAAGDMFFRATGTNPFVDTAEDRLSTFALDVDTGSWTLARSYLDRGSLPPAEAIRVEEFVNAQSFDDPAPRRGDFTLVAEGAPSPFAAGSQYRLLRFAVKAREIDARDRKPANLTFVVDVSGSMNQENRLGLVKRALGLLLDELGGDDRVALVVYGTQGRVLLRHTRDHEAIREAIAALRPEGSTNAEAGLRFGYDLADEAWQQGAINRVILCSDGVANVGATGPESILARIGAEARRGIELTTVGFGMGNYNDALMEQLADQGDGAYHYVDSLDEARRIFVENLTGTLQTVAKDAKVQVEFDPQVVDRWRLVGYENRDVADRDFRNDAVDAGEIGVGHSAVALYEVRLREGARATAPVGTLRLRWKSRATKQVEEAALTLEVDDLEDSFRGASDNLRTAAVAAELAEMLKGSFYAKEAGWRALAAEAHRLARDARGTEALRDLVGMIDRASGLGDTPTRRPGRDDRRDDD